MDIKQLKREYNRSVNAYLEAFCDKHGFDYTEAVRSWVGGRVGEVVIIGDYFFDFATIRTDMDEDAPEEELMKHYDYCVQAESLGLTSPNFTHWIKGCPRVSAKKMGELQRKKAHIDSLKAELKMMISDLNDRPEN